MASFKIDAPGAYPATPLNEEQQTQPGGQSFAKDTPRSLRDNVHPRGHYFNNSGIYVDDSSFGNGNSSSSTNVKEPSRSSGNDVHPSGHKFKDSGVSVDDSLRNNVHPSGHSFKNSGIYVDDSSISNERAQPGVMTGAYSRLGAQDSAPRQNANYTYDDKSTAQPSRGNNSVQHSVGLLRGLDTRTDVNTPANTPAAPATPLDSTINNNSTSPNPNAKEHSQQNGNKVQAGLRGKSSTQHNEPYWGSIPFGVGVYNGVTGHGSDGSNTQQRSLDEPDGTQTTNSGIYNGANGHGSHTPTTQPKSLDDSVRSNPMMSTGVYNGVTGHGSDAQTTPQKSLDNSASNSTTLNGSGVYNGITGHGSDESTSPRSSKYDHDNLKEASPRQQRAFPLTKNAETSTSTSTGVKPNDADTSKRDSHFKEALAGAGAAAAGGYAAHEYSSKNDRARDGSNADEVPKQKKPSEIAAALAYRPAKHDRTDGTVAGDKDLRNRKPVVATAAPQYQNDHRHEPMATDPAEKSSKASQTKSYPVMYSHSAKDKGAAPDVLPSQKNRSLVNEAPVDADGEDKRRGDSNLGYYGAAAAAAGAGAYGMHRYADHRDQQSLVPENKEVVAPSATSRRVAGDEPSSSTAAMRDQQPQYKTLSDGTPSGIANEPLRQKPQHQYNQYNTLSDGTASGITNDAVRDNVHDKSQHNNLSGGVASGIAASGIAGESSRAWEQPQYSNLSDGTASGIANETSREKTQYKTLSDGTASGVANEPFNSSLESSSRDGHTHTSRSSSDSSQGGLYNVLASGTPSGINLEHVHHHHH
ncbi:hypothetical protein F5Y03DRAFT_128839 [Xylaria venustula]|nr:hypothetical protein F5Y03DRAFT_128839 [Xylaria venustula]